jgi:hypothetical protein
MSSPDDASAARLALRRIAQQLPGLIEGALGVRAEVLPASLSKTYKVCGKPNCKCARGEKHEVYQLSWTEDGRRRSTHIRQDEVDKVRATVERYRHLRRCRAELLRLASEAASLLDALVEALRVPPPDKSGGSRR